MIYDELHKRFVYINIDGIVKSRHSCEIRSPDKL